MAKQSRRKKNGVLATLIVELSALASIFGIAQPTVRNNLWQLLQPTTVKSQLNQTPQVTEVTPGLDQLVSQPEPYTPSYVPQSYRPQVSQPWANDAGVYPSTPSSAYTARAILPRDVRNRTTWSPSGYNPMGTYQ